MVMDIAIDGPTNVFYDNESIVKYTIQPKSRSKKKHDAASAVS